MHLNNSTSIINSFSPLVIKLLFTLTIEFYCMLQIHDNHFDKLKNPGTINTVIPKSQIVTIDNSLMVNLILFYSM